MVSSLWNLWNNLRLRACRQLLVQVVALPVQFLIRTYCSSVGTSLLRKRSCCSEMNCALAGQHPSWTRVVPILDPSGGSRLFQTCQRTRGGVHRSDWSAIRKTLWISVPPYCSSEGASLPERRSVFPQRFQWTSSFLGTKLDSSSEDCW